MLRGAVIGALDEAANISVDLAAVEKTALLQDRIVVGVGEGRWRRILIILGVRESSDQKPRERWRLVKG